MSDERQSDPSIRRVKVSAFRKLFDGGDVSFEAQTYGPGIGQSTSAAANLSSASEGRDTSSQTEPDETPATSTDMMEAGSLEEVFGVRAESHATDSSPEEASTSIPPRPISRTIRLAPARARPTMSRHQTRTVSSRIVGALIFERRFTWEMRRHPRRHRGRPSRPTISAIARRPPNRSRRWSSRWDVRSPHTRTTTRRYRISRRATTRSPRTRRRALRSETRLPPMTRTSRQRLSRMMPVNSPPPTTYWGHPRSRRPARRPCRLGTDLSAGPRPSRPMKTSRSTNPRVPIARNPRPNWLRRQPRTRVLLGLRSSNPRSMKARRAERRVRVSRVI